MSIHHSANSNKRLAEAACQAAAGWQKLLKTSNEQAEACSTGAAKLLIVHWWHRL